MITFNYLVNFRPAEILLLREGFSAPYKKILQYTLFDLILKKVLVISKVVPPYDNRVSIPVISKGSEFSAYTPDIFEKHFLVLLEPGEDLYFTVFISRLLARLGKERRLKSAIIQTRLPNYFRRWITDRLLMHYPLNAVGTEVQNEINLKINNAVSTLQESEKPVPEIIYRIKEIYGNIIFLGLSNSLLAEIGKEIFTTSAPGEYSDDFPLLDSLETILYAIQLGGDLDWDFLDFDIN